MRKYLSKDAAGIGPRHPMHGIKAEPEVGALQQFPEAAKVVQALHQLQIVLYWINHLRIAPGISHRRARTVSGRAQQSAISRHWWRVASQIGSAKTSPCTEPFQQHAYSSTCTSPDPVAANLQHSAARTAVV